MDLGRVLSSPIAFGVLLCVVLAKPVMPWMLFGGKRQEQKACSELVLFVFIGVNPQEHPVTRLFS